MLSLAAYTNQECLIILVSKRVIKYSWHSGNDRAWLLHSLHIHMSHQLVLARRLSFRLSIRLRHVCCHHGFKVNVKGMVMHYMNRMWLSSCMNQAACMCTTGSDTGLKSISTCMYYLDLLHPDAQVAFGIEWHLQVCDSPVNKYALQRDDQRVTLKLGQAVCFSRKLIAACNTLQGPSATIRIFCLCHSWCWSRPRPVQYTSSVTSVRIHIYIYIFCI